jgi:hypothetical protein
VLLREAEVCDDGSAVVQEDVGQFEVAVQVAALCHLDEATDDVFEQFEGFLFGDPSAFLEEAAEVALVAVLRDDVAVGGLSDHIEALQDVGVFDLGECLYFAI